ncbi:hypothetical protein INH39_03805 [Massilia violaceinigra]|uniref:Uncharacterized protein n=1 Tax=Massilia violaceinigra TaxID=2045208 RepID=A0ABY4A9P4_9BURK|nr:O-methyltransferase [Massilia violaceinigra]UOD30870.1 hypothetical protein INH39_03805 [Massilia violaceinigra]
MSRSFEFINYMVRPNKNVERKLIASSLDKIKFIFSLSKYRYVGFGSMWFTDFVLFHRLLGICDMVTIEKEKSREKRVRFNKPFACIDVRMGDASDHLGELLEGKNSLTWLDYDGSLENALNGDILTAVGAMQSGSIILVSVNAMVEQLDGKTVDGRELTSLEYLEWITETLPLKDAPKRLTRNDFPCLVSEILISAFESAVFSTMPGCEFFPMWNFLYADGAKMITVGGMVADSKDRQRLSECYPDGAPTYFSKTPFEISLPILTDKEKRALDTLMPTQKEIKPKSLEFELRPTEIEAYQKFYLEYPIFNELSA